MPALPTAVHVVAWLALGTGVGVAFVRQNEVLRRLDEAESDRAAPVAAPAGGDLAGGREIVTLKKQLEDLKGQVTNAAREDAKLRADHDRLVLDIMASPDGARAVSADAASSKFVEKPGFEDAVRGVVDRYAMEQKFRDTLKKAAGPIVPKKPRFEELAKALKLTEAQATRLQGDVHEMQMELYEVLQMPRSDGVAPWEEIMQAEQYPEGDPKKAAAFLKLFKLTIPDTQETYIERAIALTSRVKTSTKAYFDQSQSELLDTIDLDWFGIKMPQ